MNACRILIVEDDPLVSMHLETIIARTFDAQVTVTTSVAEAEAALQTPIDFAFLDVDVLDGTTYAFASRLVAADIAFAFVSASDRDLVPLGLQTAPFVTKPYTDHDIVGLLTAAGKMPVG